MCLKVAYVTLQSKVSNIHSTDNHIEHEIEVYAYWYIGTEMKQIIIKL